MTYCKDKDMKKEENEGKKKVILIASHKDNLVRYSSPYRETLCHSPPTIGEILVLFTI
jgi:hypothetical protein